MYTLIFSKFVSDADGMDADGMDVSNRGRHSEPVKLLMKLIIKKLLMWWIYYELRQNETQLKGGQSRLHCNGN